GQRQVFGDDDAAEPLRHVGQLEQRGHGLVGFRSAVVFTLGSSELSTTCISSGNLVPFCHCTPTGGVIATPGAGPPEAKFSGPATAWGRLILWMAAATSALSWGSLTEDRAAWAASNRL